MLDPDISTADAKRLLSLPTGSHGGPDDGLDVVGPDGWTRRGFLQAVGVGLGGGLVAGSLGESLIPGDVRDAYAGPPLGANEGVLVNIVLYGGNDGLNTVVPYTDGNYYSQRSNVAIPQNQVRQINGQIGLHPELDHLHSLYQQGQVAIVQGVGYPNPDLSHFTSMAIWMGARFGPGAPTSGWIGRWLDGLPADRAILGAATIDSSVALHLQGVHRRGVGISPWGDMFVVSTEGYDVRMYAGLGAMATAAGRGQWHDQFASTMRTQLELATEVAPAFASGLPTGGLTRKMTIAARMINADIGMRIVDVGLDGCDTHDDQVPDNHARLLRELDDAIAAFYAVLSPSLRDRVTIMTMSEFGRTSWSNQSRGTDHGTSAPLFVIGSRVKGGLYGQAAPLAGLRRWDRMASYVDFRWVIGSVLDGWMGGGGSTIVQGNFTNLGLFHSGPGAPPTSTPIPPIVTVPPAPASGFVPTAPVRVFDTRDGTGGRTSPLAAGETWRFQIAGVNGVPADAVAVAINLTAVGATMPTFVTVHPSGGDRPVASNLNPVPGVATPNLVIARVGTGGSIDLFNNAGYVHLLADVVGWFVTSGDVGMSALAPARLLDTRDGGVPLGLGQTIELQVGGRGGVSADAAAVVLNVTATEPTGESYLTVWPTGQGRPLASSVNMVRGQTVPNLVLAKLGDGGRVNIYNHSGSAHVVVDVLGCFGSGVSSRFVAVSPQRVLDTREGMGAPAVPLASGAMTLALAGRSGVPATGASAVLLNVTAVTPSAPTYVTVYPTGIDRPTASNLNAGAGQVVPNMVVARLGADGCVHLFSHAGTVDLVADVMGWFTT
ncbi:MAG: DUF1501 domain-containing protein [Actinomycetes bacterium]